MTSMFSLADFMLRRPPGGESDWLTPSPFTVRGHTPRRHDERGMGTFNWPKPGTSTWPPADTFSRPRTSVPAGQSLPVKVPGQCTRKDLLDSLLRLTRLAPIREWGVDGR